MIAPQTHEQYAQRVGAPRVVTCDIDLGSGSFRHGIWICRTHDYEFNDRPWALNHRLSDRCPMSRLEEWRARKWEAA